MSTCQIGRNHIDLDDVTDAAMGTAGLELHLRHPEDDSTSVLTVGQPDDIDRALELLEERRPDLHVRNL